ncbi:MAG TPA: ABC transporter ATP-binding protein [Anaerolineales bacterium]
MSILQTIGLSKTYGEGDVSVRALEEVSLSIETGEFVSVMGPSGSGKSTLLNILGCLDRPSAGRYLLDSVDVSQMDRAELARIRNERIGFVFQSYNLLPRTSALKNVVAPLLYSRNHGRTKDEKLAIARQAMESVGLGDRLEHQPQQLSGGQQQRVAIARAFVTDPAFILADEPTGNLDSQTGQEILSLLAGLHRQGRTILVITHSEEIAALTDRTIRLRDGRVERIVRNWSNSDTQAVDEVRNGSR